MVHAHVIRQYSHSLSDDDFLYRPATEHEKAAKPDPKIRLQMYLIREAFWTKPGENKLKSSGPGS